MPRTSVYVCCSLCSAKTSSFASEDIVSATRAAESEAEASGFRRLPAVHEEKRRRFEGWLCGPCVVDAAALLTRSAEPAAAIPTEVP